MANNALTEKEISWYLGLVDRRLELSTSGINWESEYKDELQQIDKELADLRVLLDAEHRRRTQVAG